MKAQILKLLRQRFAKQNKAIPQGLDAVELDKRAEKIAASLEKAKYDGPIDANLINLIEAERTKIQKLSDADLNTMATKLGLNDPSKNRFLQKDNVFDMEGNKIPDGAKIMGGKELKETVEQASKRGDPAGVFKAMQNNPEYADIMKDFALSKKFPFSVDQNVRSGEDAIPLARAAKFDEEMNELGISATPGKDADNTVGEFVDQMKKFNVSDKDIQMMLGSGKSGQVPYVMEQYGMSASDVVDTLKRGDPLIEGMAQGGRIGFKDGPNMGRRNFLKIMGGLAAIPIVGKFFKVAKVGKTVTKVPVIKTAEVAGKPEWFDALVNKVILEGDDVTAKFATGERQTIHSKDFGDGTAVRVTQDTDQGAVRVEYESEQNVFGDTATMEYKKPLPDEGDPNPAAEFSTAESGPVGRQVGPDDYDIDIDEVGGSSISDLDSDVSKLKEYATGEKPTMKEIVQNKKRKDKADNITNDPEAQSDAIIRRQGDYDPEYDDYATGGRVGLVAGKFVKVAQLLKNKKKIDQAVDNIFPTGDYKMDAEMAAESLVELNPKVFGNKLYEDLDDRTRIDIYGAVINQVQKNNLMASKMKKASKPTKTLEGIEKTGTINISDPAVAEEFTKFMKETSPGDAKKLEQTLELDNFDPKGRKKNNAGGVAYMLGE